MKIIETILNEFGPCSTSEVLDYLNSDFFYNKGNYSSHDWTKSNIRYYLDKISQENEKIFKFESSSGYKVRYGLSNFEYYLRSEPRFLKVKGQLKRCIYCGMPIYANENNEFHFKYKCEQCIPQDYFKLVKLNSIWVIISRDYVFGVLDDLSSCSIRLPGKNQDSQKDNSLSELWLINEKARELELIEEDRLLTLKADEFIV